MKPHHFRKTAYIGGYLGGFAPPPPPPPPAQVVYKTVEAPAISKRVDVVAEGAVDSGVESGVGYTKTISYQRNPTFFADIFNVSFSVTLKIQRT